MTKKITVVIFYLMVFFLSIPAGEKLARKIRGERYLDTIQYRLEGSRVIGRAINPRQAKLANFALVFEALDKRGRVIGKCQEDYQVKLPEEIWEFDIPCSVVPYRVQPSELTYSLFNL